MSETGKEPGVIPGRSNRGAQPIRMRGYYRAVKRGHEWAMKIERLKDKSPLQWLLALTYRNVDWSKIAYSKNPVLAILSKEDNFSISFKLSQQHEPDCFCGYCHEKR